MLSTEEKLDLLPKITLRDQAPVTQVWLTKADAIKYAERIEDAVYAKLTEKFPQWVKEQ